MFRDPQEWPTSRQMNEQAMKAPHLLVLPPAGGSPYFAWLEDGQSIEHILSQHLHADPDTDSTGRLRVFFCLDATAHPPNPLADQVLTALGHHRTGWRGTVILTMEEDQHGTITAMTGDVLATLEELTTHRPDTQSWF